MTKVRSLGRVLEPPGTLVAPTVVEFRCDRQDYIAREKTANLTMLRVAPAGSRLFPRAHPGTAGCWGGSQPRTSIRTTSMRSPTSITRSGPNWTPFGENTRRVRARKDGSTGPYDGFLPCAINFIGHASCLLSQVWSIKNCCCEKYLAAENRILRAHLPGRLRLSDAERSTLAEIAERLGRTALREIARVAKAGYSSRLVPATGGPQVRRF
jgi:hypothetical protein